MIKYAAPIILYFITIWVYMSYDKVDVLDPYYLAITAIVTIGFQSIFFIITATLKFDKVTDFAGGSNFLILAVLTLFLNGSFYSRQIVDTSLVSIWAIRLAVFLLVRILIWGKDNRFDDIRENLIKLAVFWFLQALWVWTVSLPIIILNSSEENRDISALDYIGWFLFTVGFIIEVIADIQKLLYKRNESNHWCDRGLWKWSRHPNYFGEILLWWGIFMSVGNILSDWEWITIISPLFISFLLLFVSGIPIQERAQDERYCNSDLKPLYVQYKKQTSPLIPLPPVIYSKIPLNAKILLFEFPFYSPNVRKILN